MAKAETPKTAAQDVTTPVPAMPVLGATCLVKVAAGVVLMNNETGTYFEPELYTPVTVTVTLLRRLQDGDLTLA